ncbi:LysM peptidoglycan-binding domain-containing protein [Cupriavidus sp. SW-Y-13]|uniref:LysM peptidoglycan-binding domain-containing protein n=1 Tax=Cupriavidus sp. SW-Y-13 TaxID=2653854 RepID=UPI00136546E0|nr:LysM peptidoglycan-binding domain-containing protein [Cupriavidus sp. SW-Y-13]MWL88896.1 LysM peptidoglycan-binding domain-containing protein [Cupriavidus sp. SW-Y-13]
MRDITKQQAASGRRLHAFTLAMLSAACVTAGAAAAVQAADLAISPAQRAEADITAQQGIPISELATDAPGQYTVRSGDTLWGISGKYLRQPWRWPALWGMNRQQIGNPHLIYPGQILYLVQRDGRAYLSTTAPGGASGGDIRLSPRVRGEGDSNNAIPSIPSSDIEPFLKRPLVVDQQTVATSARIVALTDARVYMGRGDTGYVRGIAPTDSVGSDWQAFKPAQPVYDPITQAVLGYEAQYQGNVRLTRGPEGPDAVATVQVTQSPQEMGAGSLLLPQPARELVRYVPHAPDTNIEARIAAVYGGVEYGGAKQVVVLNLGTNAGLEPGHVLALSRTGGQVKDATDGNRTITLPDDRYGLAYVYRVFPGIAYALVTDATNVMKVGDLAKTPQ